MKNCCEGTHSQSAGDNKRYALVAGSDGFLVRLDFRGSSFGDADWCMWCLGSVFLVPGVSFSILVGGRWCLATLSGGAFYAQADSADGPSYGMRLARARHAPWLSSCWSQGCHFLRHSVPAPVTSVPCITFARTRCSGPACAMELGWQC